MACVVTLSIVTGGRLTIGHVGDSRLYKMRPPTACRKLTHDHSPVGEREDAREISEIGGDAPPAAQRGVPRRRRRAARQGRGRVRRGHRGRVEPGRVPCCSAPTASPTWCPLPRSSESSRQHAGTSGSRSSMPWSMPRTRPAVTTTSRSCTPKGPPSQRGRAKAAPERDRSGGCRWGRTAWQRGTDGRT